MSKNSPNAWMRKWAFDGEEPHKEKRENGRLAWPRKYKLLPITENKCLDDDVPLVAAKDYDELKQQLAAEKERADYAWRNANTIEKARQEEMAKRDHLERENAKQGALLNSAVQQRDELLALVKKCALHVRPTCFQLYEELDAAMGEKP